MKYEIFQICFDKNQISQVDPLFKPFDNTSNEKPELRELHSFDRIEKEDIAKGLDAWGVFGPRWQEKLRYPSIEIIQSIDTNPDYDVYVFNHARVVSALTQNVWEHGEIFHQGIKRVTAAAFKEAGYNEKVLDIIMTKNVCYSSYFVASKVFWKDYLNFVRTIIDKLESLTGEDEKIYRGSANYSRDKNLTMLPFIVERLFSTFLHLNPKYKVYSKPVDFSVYRTDGYEKILTLLNQTKELSVQSDSPEVYHHWVLLRNRILTHHPELFHLD